MPPPFLNQSSFERRDGKDDLALVAQDHEFEGAARALAQRRSEVALANHGLSVQLQDSILGLQTKPRDRFAVANVAHQTGQRFHAQEQVRLALVLLRRGPWRDAEIQRGRFAQDLDFERFATAHFREQRRRQVVAHAVDGHEPVAVSGCDPSSGSA